MALEQYKAKRNFRKTTEPGPKREKSHRQPLFVIQKHAATRLHWDFRLEDEGVLKSWAVPKEPTLDPTIKRLAVHVEDHPLGYAKFHGDIPAGQYGAGHVDIWDGGTYENLSHRESITEGIEHGRIEFELHGKKLKGRFALIHMKGRDKGGKENWLLIKMKDDYAKPEESNGSRSRLRRPPQRTAKVKSNGKAPGEVVFSHPDKVMFPEPGYTKADLIDYYRDVAPRLLPHLRDRPCTLERFPDGVDAPTRFWQKNTPDYYPSWIRRVNLPHDGKPVNYVLVNDLPTLLYLVNQGAITFHVWMSRVDDLDRPDFVLFDIDRSEATFADVVTVAREVHDVLKDEGIDTLVKTTGKRGLHVLMPWGDVGGYAVAREWAMAIAQRVVREMPKIATVERMKAKRGKRVYLDVMQNDRGKHVVPAYVVRPTPGATMSMPLAWREVNDDLDPTKFDIETALKRIARQKRDPLAALAPKRRAVASR
jgi:bifunctional non-homologous end joining protein LigD